MPSLQTIAHIRSEFPEKFGIPRQSGIVSGLRSSVVFERQYRDPEALRGLESFSHIWILWGFSEAEQKKWSPTVRPPKLGGNTRMGVFATRSPYRPNSIGLSSVKIERIQLDSPKGPVIHILGADIMDGTPVYDIKPYLPFTDSHPEAAGGFSDRVSGVPLKVQLADRWKEVLPEKEYTVLCEVLSHDPRPSYQHDPGRVYGMAYGAYTVKFTVREEVLTVIDIQLRKQ